MNVTISIIVPTLNEREEVLENLAPLQSDPQIEVIIADAESVGCANRGAQMNWGACQARGEVLVFLHVDTKIQPEDLWIIYQTLQKDPALVGGAFRFALDSPSWKARVIEFGVRLREWVFGLSYGDQAIFIRRSLFEKIGGYPEVPLLEDVLLVKEMRKRGRFYSHPGRAVTSARKWEGAGYLKTTLANWTTMFLWKLGVHLDSIQAFRERIFRDSHSFSRKIETGRA